MQQKYFGCVFDIDGTLTERGLEVIPDYMREELALLSMKVPMAVCTGRDLTIALEKMNTVIEIAEDPEKCRSNWYLLCENGCIGYFYEQKTGKYKEFYKVPYPYDEDTRQKMFEEMREVMNEKLQMSFTNKVSLVYRPLKYQDADQAGVAERSRELQHIALGELKKHDPKGNLTVADAGIAITVFPKDGNKERGIAEMADFLRANRGLNIDDDARQLVVIGDQPGPHGNDEALLDGKFGTPFTVGEVHPDNVLPLPVYYGDSILRGPKGTTHLLKQLEFEFS